ncbi:MAG: HipA N-terminal domain-containing protein [Fibrobacteres bacterium]|nr:HipA N-terminal domain-containing protein [Fibrobacterota bacterium]
MARRGNVLYKNLLAGIIEENDEGYIYSYLPEYLNHLEAKPISVTLPLTSIPYQSKTFFPFFDGLIPEGWMLQVAAHNWKLDSRDRMGLLLAVCKDCIGAVRIEALNE